MDEFSFNIKKTQTFKNTKNQRVSFISFNSEKDDSNNNINNSLPKTLNNLNINNSNNNLLYKSFNKNKKNFSKFDLLNSKSNISNEYNLKIQKQNSIQKIKKVYSLNPAAFKNVKPNIINNKILNNKSKSNIDITNISNEIKNKVNNSKILSKRNIPATLNSEKFSTVKEEQEQNSYILDKNNNNMNQNLDINKEQYKIKVYYEGKNINLILNKNDKFKKLILLIQKQLLPFRQIIDYDILYKLKVLDIVNSFNIKLSEIVGDPPLGTVLTFLLRKKNIIKEKYDEHGTIITIENFPSLTDLAIDLNYFFKKETRESDFIVDYKKSICKVIFNFPEKAFSLVSFLSKLKQNNPIYKRLKVKLNYKINANENINKYKQIPQKIMLPFLKKETIENIKNKNLDFFIKSPSYKRKNIKLFLPNYFSFSKNIKKNKKSGEDILFLYRQKQNKKQKAKQFNTINNLKILSYKDKKTPTKDISEIKIKKNDKNKKIISFFSPVKNKENIPNRAKRNSVFYNSVIHIEMDNDDNNNNINSSNKKDDISKNKTLSKNKSTNKLMMKSWSNLDMLKSQFEDNKNQNEKKSVAKESVEDKKEDNNNENKKEIYLMELLKEAKMSDDSDDSSKEESSTYNKIKEHNNWKYRFKNKNKKFMFFNGLTKRERRKNIEYIGKKDD